MLLRFLYVAESGPSEGGSPLDRFVYKETWGEQLQQHSSGVVIVGSVSPAAVASIRRKDVDGSYCQVWVITMFTFYGNAQCFYIKGFLVFMFL